MFPSVPLNSTMFGCVFAGICQIYCWQLLQTVQAVIGSKSAPLITGAFPVPYASRRIGSSETPDDGKLSSSLQRLPRLSKIRLPGAKLKLLTRASVFQGAETEVPALLSFPKMLST